MKKRTVYFLLALVLGVLGFIFSVFTASLPFFVANFGSEILWVCSIYFLMAFIIAKKPTYHAIAAFCIALALELLQFIDMAWLSILRNTPVGAYILGSTFSIDDVLSIICAIAICFIGDFIVNSRKPKVRKSKYRK